jgi:hypothetical protein
LLKMTDATAIADLLDHHARLLAAGDPEAEAFARSAPADVQPLMAVAGAVQAALPPVLPDPAFRAALGRSLVRATDRSHRPWRATAGLRRLPRLATHRTAVVTSGAAMAVMGVTVAWLAGRRTRTAAG